MNYVNCSVKDRNIILWLMPAKGSDPTGSLALTPDEARDLLQRLMTCLWKVDNTPMTGAEAVAESTGTRPDQLTFEVVR